MAIGIISHSLMNYLWTFFGKFIIDILESQSAAANADITPLIHTLIWGAAIELISTGLNVLTDNRCRLYMILVRMRMMTDCVAKALSMNYQTLEQPDILDMHNKAENATGGNNVGVEGMMHNMYNIGANVLTFIVTLVIISVLDLRLILILALISFVQFLFFRYTVKKDKKKVWDVLPPVWRKIQYMQYTTQNFDSAKDIRLFGMKKWLSGKLRDVVYENQNTIFYSKKLWVYNSIFAHSMLVLSTAAVYGILIFITLGTDMSIGDFTLYVGLATAFTTALTTVLHTVGDFKQCSLKVDDFRSFLDLETDNEENCIPVPKTNKYKFEFRNVSYQYKGQEGYALKNMNLTLEAGKRLAVVGLNGAGKTTFIKLLLRLYDPTEGEILLNGTDIRRFKRKEYYEIFSPVFQNVEIFAFPMAENISMKKTEETDRELSRECAEKAGLGE
ncbi:MAG: ABC transporter ATP-binding protein/permease, partial [Ruminiclostridium sp.]|nr:ABC transporter ATP-binding protein/permease [Ruminiclostridium sp.]